MTTRIIPRKARWGLLAYRQPDGNIFTNEDGDPLTVSVHLDRKLDTKQRTERLIQAALYYGAPEHGDVVFLPGLKKVTPTQHDDQMEAFVDGKPVPDDWHDDTFEDDNG